MWLKELLLSRKFWVTLLALAVTIIANVIPNFGLDTEAGAGLLIIVFSYVFGIAIDPGLGIMGVLKSRKFWIALIGFVIMVLAAFGIQLPFGITENILVEIAVSIATLIGGIAVRDFTQSLKLPQ